MTTMEAVNQNTRLHQTIAGSEVSERDFANVSVLELVLMRVRVRSQRRATWLAQLWGQLGIDSVNSFEGHLQACLNDRDTLEAETRWYQSAEMVQPLNERLRRIEQALAKEAGERLSRLGTTFHLSEPELDLLQTCLAIAIDPTLGTVYGYLQQHNARPYATEALVARLFGYGHRSLWSPGCPLAVWGLVRAGEASPGDPSPLMLDPVVIAWLQGELHLDADLVGRVHTVSTHPPLDSWPVAETARTIERALQHQPAVRILMSGPTASGRRTFAAVVAARFGLETLEVDTSAIAEGDWPDVFVRVQRLAVMGGMALVWSGSGVHHRWPNQIALAPLQFVACDEHQFVLPCNRIVDYRIDLPSPTLDERRHLWKAAIPESVAWPTEGFETLVSRYRLNAGDISAVGQRNPGSAREASSFARELTRQRLGDLGQLLDCPFTWDDLVLSAKVRQDLEDFTFEAQERSTFWESSQAQRLFPRGTGLVALFGGLPGTGKTMAVQVIAADLELDLFRVDLATVVSKYIGETAKHLGQIFARGTRMNAVLLFDEADALFSKRTEVKDSHDRYANADTSYLLQLLEEYRGIIILATNKKQNIDSAFIRRVRYVLDFPRPDGAQRQQIWSQVIGELCGEEARARLDSTITTLAEGVEMSGAQIKNAVLASIFVARRSQESLDMAHLLRGVERELSKEGRSLGSREKGRLIGNG
jgi:hypothetical protein